MKFSMYSMAIDTFVPMLRTLSTLLDKAAAHALDNKRDFAELAGMRTQHRTNDTKTAIGYVRASTQEQGVWL